VAWKFGNGKNVQVGEDPWLGAGNNFMFSPPLINPLGSNNILYLQDACTGLPQLQGHVGWKDVASIGIPLALHDEWNLFISRLCGNFIILNS
jgi:hypothetical protein